MDRLLNRKSFRVFAALFLFSLFAGEIVADALCDAEIGCFSELSRGAENDAGCPLGMCCTHGIGIFHCELNTVTAPVIVEVGSVALHPEQNLVGFPAPIDHPPQLA